MQITRRQYFEESFINGSCDSIFGTSTIVFEQCVITITDHVTAHRGVHSGDVNTTLLFVNSTLKKPGPEEWNPHPRGDRGKTDLGRPWGPLATVIYKDTWMDAHISSAGWTDWHSGQCERFGAKCKTTPSCWCQNVTFAEYRSRGPGASKNRASWSQQLSDSEAALFTPKTILHGWQPFASENMLPGLVV
mmetsp:Transcript_7248/g.9393  ORF Transcript_7248/g.9393 Transcript_7248/m.9393 type:complete len:190 (+) Transcript_7248:1-570(+)